MSDKTKEQLQDQIDLQKQLEQERERSDQKYAVKLVERILFGLLTAFGLGIVGVIVKVVADYLGRIGQ